jgi:hypothetical protein
MLKVQRRLSSPTKDVQLRMMVSECVQMLCNLTELSLLEEVPTEDEAEQTTATKNTGRRLKREGAFILSNNNARSIPEHRQTGNFLEKIKSKHANLKPDGSHDQKDRGKNRDKGSPDADATTLSSKAKGRPPNSDKRSMKHRDLSRPLSDSEKSQSEIESLVTDSESEARHQKQKKILEKAQKEIEKLKKQLRDEKVRVQPLVNVQWVCDKAISPSSNAPALIPSKYSHRFSRTLYI